jgi:hypothetical protein
MVVTTSTPYPSLIVSERINLADPDFEPTDEQLMGLSARAFAGVAQAREHALAKLRSTISVARVQALRDYEERQRALAAKK